MTINTAQKLEAQHPPLARDPYGNLLAIPDRTSAWRICRETTGRPRELRGADKQPIRFPLDITTDELVDLCGTGVYRVYALDEVGAQLADEQVAKWDLTPGTRDVRNAGGLEAPLLGSLRPTATAPAAGVSDLRFALEAMTQMIRTNSDALRIVTESQVDLAKTLATAKGLPRNASFVAPMIDARSTEDDDDEDDRDEPNQPQGFVELLKPFAEKAAEILPGLVMGKVMQATAGHRDPKALAGSSEPPGDDDLASRPRFELRDIMDLQYAKQKGDAKRAAKEQHTVRTAAMASMQARIIADPARVQHMFAIKQHLAADEIDALMGAVAGASESEQSKFIDAIKALPVESAAEFCRDVVRAIREQSVHADVKAESR